jgi:hypothetical protein
MTAHYHERCADGTWHVDQGVQQTVIAPLGITVPVGCPPVVGHDSVLTVGPGTEDARMDIPKYPSQPQPDVQLPAAW